MKRSFGYFACALVSAASGCGPVDPNDVEPLGTVSEAVNSTGGGILIESTSNITEITDDLVQLWDATIVATNQTGEDFTTDKQMFFFASPGGYVYFPVDTAEWWPTLAAGEVAGGGFGWGFTTPVSYMVHRVDGRTSSNKKAGTLHTTVVQRPGFADPEPTPFVDDIAVGVSGPLEILPLTSGQRWLPVLATFIDTTSSSTATPTIAITARNASGHWVATLTRTMGPIHFPVRPFAAWTSLSSNAQPTTVHIKAQLSIAGKTVTSTRSIPVTTATPVVLASPVSGRWSWDNGPGRTGWNDVHSAPNERYGYDMCIRQIVNGVSEVFSGDPTVNENYFCWDKPIRAAKAGTVVFATGEFPDNNGNLHDNDIGSNNVVIRHADGVYTTYAHLRQGSVTVSAGQTVAAGQVIGKLGNSGGTSGPHLHFTAVKIDATGRVRALPMTISGLKSTSGTPLSGIPKSPFEYVTP